MQTTKGIITRLLTNLGSSREVDQYLKQFASVDAEKFAVIKVGGGIIRDHLDSLASALTFLQQVGLSPIVIHGASPQLNAALEQEGIETTKVDGLRVTPPEVLDIARRTFQKVSLQLVDELEKMGTGARPIASGVFQASIMDEQKYGLVGEVTQIHTDQIDSSIKSGHMPILACLGETSSGQILNINADIAARELALAVQPYKIIFLTPTGGLLNDRDQIITAVNLTEDFEDLMSKPWIHSGMRLKLQEVKQLLDQLPITSSVSITSPDHLAKELFTHQGSGTLLKMGERVGSYDSFDQIHTDKLRMLLEECFQRKLSADYFETKECERIYLTDSYCATAIITREESVPYLDKFAVTSEAQGLGLAASLWSRMKKDIPKLFWRSRSGNPINTWYFQQAQGSFRDDKWVVFWYGMDSYEDIRNCVERALNLPASLKEEVCTPSGA